MARTTLEHIPFAYRFVFLWFEPLAAPLGTFLLWFNPELILNTMSPMSRFAPDSKVIYDQLAATYALFAYNEAILLRSTNDLRVWRTVVIGILLCDAMHMYASWAALGSVFWSPGAWRWEDWVNLGSLWGQAAVRVAFMAGIGLQGNLRVKTD